MIGLRNKKERSRQNECNKVYSETIFHVIFQLTKGTERLQKNTKIANCQKGWVRTWLKFRMLGELTFCKGGEGSKTNVTFLHVDMFLLDILILKQIIIIHCIVSNKVEISHPCSLSNPTPAPISAERGNYCATRRTSPWSMVKLLLSCYIFTYSQHNMKKNILYNSL